MNKLHMSGLATLVLMATSTCALQNISSADFNKSINSSKIAVVDFYADWCNPCRAMKKTLASVEKLYKETSFYAVNIDKEASLATKFNVKSIPTVIFFKNGVAVARVVGAVSQSEISSKIDSLL